MPAPPNDDVANAIAFIGGAGTSIVGDTTGATVQTGEDVSDGLAENTVVDHTVWYSYTPEISGNVSFQTESYSSDNPDGANTNIQVFEGGISEGNTVTEGDTTEYPYTELFNTGGEVAFQAIVGHTYYIQVGDSGGSDPANEEGHFTLILAEAGETPVEALAIGDLVVTGSGALQPVKWIGRRSFSARFAGGKAKIQPIRISAGTLGDSLPKRDLWVSPCHAMLIEGLLIPATRLVNGVTITQPEATADFDYFHIELEHHDVVVAEGAPSETFLDDFSRGKFHNAAEFNALYPNDRTNPLARFCAPRVEDGFELQAVLKRLKAIALCEPMAKAA